jgi:hypothetical protein
LTVALYQQKVGLKHRDLSSRVPQSNSDPQRNTRITIGTRMFLAQKPQNDLSPSL